MNTQEIKTKIFEEKILGVSEYLLFLSVVAIIVLELLWGGVLFYPIFSKVSQLLAT